jgi:predicted  nucleic acid-binding Zn-ribbon protein
MGKARAVKHYCYGCGRTFMGKAAKLIACPTCRADKSLWEKAKHRRALAREAENDAYAQEQMGMDEPVKEMGPITATAMIEKAMRDGKW